MNQRPPADPPPGRRLSRREALLAGIVPLLAAATGGCGRPDGGSAAPGPATTTPSASTQAPATGEVRSGLVAFGDFGGGPGQPAVAAARPSRRWRGRWNGGPPTTGSMRW